MPCLCTTNTLRLFIRSVAQVDLPSSTIQAPYKQWQKTAIRNFTSSRAVREPHSNASSSTFTSNQDMPFDRYPPKTQERQVGSKSWPQGLAEEGIRLASDGQAEAESAPVKSVKGLSKVARRKKQRYAAPAADIKPTIRKTKTENTGLTIHYSSPRISPQAQPAFSVPKSDTKSKLKTSSSTKEKEQWTTPPREHWQLDKAALKEKFPEGWKPLKKLSPDALAGIRALHAQSPEQYTTEVLASSFKISPEAIRRILKSKWAPSADEEMDRQRRWLTRGKSIYTRHAELGQKPPKKWRDMGIGKGKPEWMLRNQRMKERAPLPALITTSRAKDAKYGLNGRGEESLEDRIL